MTLNLGASDTRPGSEPSRQGRLLEQAVALNIDREIEREPGLSVSVAVDPNREQVRWPSSWRLKQPVSQTTERSSKHPPAQRTAGSE